MRLSMHRSYRDYRSYKKAVWLRIRESNPNTVIVQWFRRKDVKRWLEYGLIEPPELPAGLWNEFTVIPHAQGSPTCAAAELDDGTIEECVVFIEGADAVTPYRNLFDVPARVLVPAARLRRIFPSPRKLPIRLEEEMNQHGETHMGGMVVNFVLRDGTKFGHASGSANSAFVATPEGCVPDEIVDVEFVGEPGVVQTAPTLQGPDWKYCVFRAPAHPEEG